jgi:glyoxylase-like metal-dependent hydrolase (beta-lactamase superfamily II)
MTSIRTSSRLRPTAEQGRATPRPSRAGLFAAVLAATVAGLYLLIGLELVPVPGVAEVEPGPAVPLVLAGVLFTLLAAALAWRPTGASALLGTALTIAVLVGYVVIAPEREPSYEAWGLSLKGLQLLLLVPLMLIAVHAGRSAAQALPGTAGSRVREIAPDVFCIGPHGRTLTNVYLVRTAAGPVLVDAGWAGDADRIADAVRQVLGDQTPAAIVLTHVHPDHSGAAQALAHRWSCPVHLHEAELPIATGDFATMVEVAGPMDRWLVLPIMRLMPRRRREQALTTGTLAGLTRILPPGNPLDVLPGWDVVATPGHTPGHVSFFRRADGVLISGDALVTTPMNHPVGLLRGRHQLSGPPWYTSWDRDMAAASIRVLESLEPRVIAGGHGLPFADPETRQQLHELTRRGGAHDNH